VDAPFRPDPAVPGLRRSPSPPKKRVRADDSALTRPFGGLYCAPLAASAGNAAWVVSVRVITYWRA